MVQDFPREFINKLMQSLEKMVEDFPSSFLQYNHYVLNFLQRNLEALGDTKKVDPKGYQNVLKKSYTKFREVDY